MSLIACSYVSSNEQGLVNVPFWGFVSHHLQIFAGNYIPNSWKMWNIGTFTNPFWMNDGDTDNFTQASRATLSPMPGPSFWQRKSNRNPLRFTGWWFGCHFWHFPINIGNNNPNWLIFFRGVQTTNQFRKLWNMEKMAHRSLGRFGFWSCSIPSAGFPSHGGSPRCDPFSNDGIFHEFNHPASWGYLHDELETPY